MDDKGRVYKKDWDGEYRPAEGFFGDPEANVKRSLLTGEPEPARDWLGNQKRAADGTPLYKSEPDRTAEAAGGLIGLAIILFLALAAAAVWLLSKVVGWWWPRVSTSFRKDIADRRLSWTTLAWLTPVILLGVWVGASALRGGGATSSSGFPLNNYGGGTGTVGEPVRLPRPTMLPLSSPTLMATRMPTHTPAPTPVPPLRSLVLSTIHKNRSEVGSIDALAAWRDGSRSGGYLIACASYEDLVAAETRTTAFLLTFDEAGRFESSYPDGMSSSFDLPTFKDCKAWAETTRQGAPVQLP